MKKFIAIAGLVLSGALFTNAQAQTTTENVKVNVIFQEVLSITVAADQKNIDLIFDSVEDYRNGVEAVKENHLTVTSTRANYEVSVRALNNQFSSTSGGNLNANQVAINIAGGTDVSLDQNARAAYTSNQNAIEKRLNVTYKAKGNEITNNGAIERNFVGKTFSGDVVYSIAVK